MKLSFFITFALFSIFCLGQSTTMKIDNDYFLLGTLNDYMGREKYKKITDRVDEYWDSDKSLVSFIEAVYRNKYQDLTIIKNKNTKRSELHSKLLARKINNFFEFKRTGRGAYNGDKSNLDSLQKTPDFIKTNFDAVYSGTIKTGIFKNDIHKLSFITGAYIRYGRQKDSLYYISAANSASKVRVATELLKQLKCTNVEYIIKKTIPVSHAVYFTPTEQLKNYLNFQTKTVESYPAKSE